MKKILAATFFLSLSFFIATAFFWHSSFWFLKPEYPAAYFLLGIGIILFISGLIGCSSLLYKCFPKLLILWLAISIIVLFFLFPPWARTYRLPSSNIKAIMPIGYRFLLHPPEANRESGVSVDFQRLGLQCGIVVLLTGGLYFTLSTIQKAKKPTGVENI